MSPPEQEARHSIPLQVYVDSQIEEVRRAVEVALSSAKGEAVPLREFVEAMFDQQRRADERAEREREKAADVLAAQLSRSIAEGDDRLREHVSQQITQIKSALDAADKLEVQRLEAALASVVSVQRQLEIQHHASQEAIAKAEGATEKRFHSVNAFREQLAAERATFLPREVADAQFAEIRRSVAELSEKLAKVGV